jgi:hypothetical protein
VTRRRAGIALALLVAAVLAYVLAAWSVAPGFFDGLAPPGPYRWASPPPQFKQGNQPPLSGRGTAAVGPTGEVQPGTVQTQDNQAAISFIPGAFKAPADRSPVTIEITPQRRFPDPGNIQLATNVYCFASRAPIASGHDVLITLTYSDGIAAPRDIYGYQDNGPWRKVGNTGTSAPYTISAQPTWLGCFAAGIGRSATTGGGGGLFGSGTQTLPVVVAVLIVLVLLAGLPLVLLRRRRGEDEEEEGAAGKGGEENGRGDRGGGSG